MNFAAVLRLLFALALALAGCAGASAPASRGDVPVTPHVADREALAREQLRCTGTLDSGRALAEVEARRARATDCYQRVIAHDPRWHVRVRVDLVVERGGDVSTVSVGDVDREDFAECLANALEGLHLPPVRGGECAIVGVPYGFHTEAAR